MILTRLGHGSKMIINGDLTQIDIVYKRSRIKYSPKTYKFKKYKFVNLNKKDVVRHNIVSEIISACE